MWIDLTFAILTAVGFYWGYSRGIIRTVASLAAILVGFIAAVRFARPTTNLLADLFNTSPDGAMPLIGFVTAFVLVLAILRLAVTLIERALSAVRLNFINKMIGGFATAVIAALIFSILLMFVNSANLISFETKAESLTYQSLEEFPHRAYELIGKAKPALEEVRDAGKEAIEAGKKDGAL